MGRKVKIEGKVTVRVHSWVEVPDDESIDETISRVANGELVCEWEHEKNVVLDKKTLDIREEINTKE